MTYYLLNCVIVEIYSEFVELLVIYADLDLAVILYFNHVKMARFD